nr:AMP-binding protein [Saprospiraceae bacterium]
MQNLPKLLWTPTDDFVNESNLAKYAAWLRHEQGITFDNYEEIWKWSVTDIERFWESIWDYFEVISHTPYKQVLDTKKMPGAKWFNGATLNYAEHIFARKHADAPAIIYKTENCEACELSWAEVESRTASLAAAFREWGLQAGDCVVGYMPNIPEASIAFLAACSQGMIWSSCSPDFGVESIVDRFKQIEPKVLIACDGYTYNGKPY